MTSKVYYHLGEYNDALVYALAAGDQFDVNEKSEYVDTMIAKCIDSYCDKRKAKDSNAPNAAAAAAAISPKVMAEQEAIVNKMFERCFADKQWKDIRGKGRDESVGSGSRRLRPDAKGITWHGSRGYQFGG